jgi:hypothetical protein
MGVRIRLANQNEMKMLALQRQTKRLTTEQIISQDGNPSLGVKLTLFFHPAFGRLDLTILLFMPVLGNDELRFQRNYMFIPRLDDYGCQGTMKIVDFSIAQFTMVTIFAMDVLG